MYLKSMTPSLSCTVGFFLATPPCNHALRNQLENIIQDRKVLGSDADADDDDNDRDDDEADLQCDEVAVHHVEEVGRLLTHCHARLFNRINQHIYIARFAFPPDHV